MKRRWFLFFLKRSLSARKGRLVTASVSVTLAVSVVTVLIAVTAGIRVKIGQELKAYGANMIVSPAEGDYLDSATVGRLLNLEHVEDATGQILGSLSANGRMVEIVGTDIRRLRDRGWRVTGRWPVNERETLAGINLKDDLKLVAGKTVRLEGRAGSGTGNEFLITGFVERGGPEDTSFIIDISGASRLLALDGKVSVALVRGTPGHLEAIMRNIERNMPVVSVKLLRNIALPEESLLSKMQLLLVLVTLVVLFASSITVAGTMGANVLERREEIGLMKALGATRTELGLFYRAEAGLIGFLGGFAGTVLGVIAAEGISKGAFNSFLSVPLYLPLLSLAAGVLLSLLASGFPVRDAVRDNPARILRGE